MKGTIIFMVVSAVILGALAGSFIGNYILHQTTKEILVSSDHVSEDQITVHGTNVAIDLGGKHLRWSRYENTNSMLPLLDEGYNGLEFVPESADEIHVGDVISFVYNGENYVHRAIEINNDGYGWYAITKGDNNQDADKGKRRFADVKGVLIGVVF